MKTDYNYSSNQNADIIAVSFASEFFNSLYQIKIKNVIYQSKQPECSTINSKQTTDKLPIPKKKGYNGTVDPIKDINDIEAAKAYFLNKPARHKNNPTNIRNYALFVLGINCARRIGDILQLKIRDVLNEDMSFKYYIGENQSVGIEEQKTKKTIRIKLNDAAKDALKMYFDALPEINFDDPIFKSGKSKNINQARNNYEQALASGNKKKIKYAKERLDIAINFTNSLEPRSVSTIIKEMSREIGLDKKGININTHSMRKTKAYHVYKKEGDIERVLKLLNHSKVNISRRYIGIDQEEIDEACDLNL